jgi:hypothetical protein
MLVVFGGARRVLAGFGADFVQNAAFRGQLGPGSGRVVVHSCVFRGTFVSFVVRRVSYVAWGAGRVSGRRGRAGSRSGVGVVGEVRVGIVRG